MQFVPGCALIIEAENRNKTDTFESMSDKDRYDKQRADIGRIFRKEDDPLCAKSSKKS